MAFRFYTQDGDDIVMMEHVHPDEVEEDEGKILAECGFLWKVLVLNLDGLTLMLDRIYADTPQDALALYDERFLQ